MIEELQNFIILFGVCPLPIEKSGISMGPMGRTYQFALPLLQNGYSVILISQKESDYHNYFDKDKSFEDVIKTQPIENLQIYRFPEDKLRNISEIKNTLSNLDFSKIAAIIGAGSLLPNHIAVRFRQSLIAQYQIPLWVDLYGDPIAEIQSKIDGESNEEKEAALFHVWKIMNEILLTADKISVVSEPQKYEAIGQLSITGRLNSFSANYDFVSVIPCGIDEKLINIQTNLINELRKSKAELRKKHSIPEDAFVIYWCGSYNTWMDADTLFKGIEKAIEKNNKIHFLSTGGEIKGYCENIYEEFKNNITNSKYVNNFHLKGWIDESLIHECFAISDIGINVDRKTYEGVFGSRNRILHFVSVGLPVLTTILTNLTKELYEKEIVFNFDIGNPKSLSEKLSDLSKSTDTLISKAYKGRGFAINKYNFNKTLEPLINWLKRAALSPDIYENVSKKSIDNKSVNYIIEYMNYQKMSDTFTNLPKQTAKENLSIVKKIKKILEKN